VTADQDLPKVATQALVKKNTVKFARVVTTVREKETTAVRAGQEQQEGPPEPKDSHSTLSLQLSLSIDSQSHSSVSEEKPSEIP